MYQQGPAYQPVQSNYHPPQPPHPSNPTSTNPDALKFESFTYGQPPNPAYMTSSIPTYGGVGGGGGIGSAFDPSSSGGLMSSGTHLMGNPTVTWSSIREAFLAGGLPDEPPLLEELGINFSHIVAKGVTALNPFRPVDKHIMDDTDLAGPLIFCFLFGGLLLLIGKVHFGYIYSTAMLGVLSIYLLLNLMSENRIDGSRTASVLGYSMLPMVLLVCLSALLHLGNSIAGTSNIDNSPDWIQIILGILAVLWCTHSASTMFVAVLSMNDQRLLVAYPVGLVYLAFALLAMF